MPFVFIHMNTSRKLSFVFIIMVVFGLYLPVFADASSMALPIMGTPIRCANLTQNLSYGKSDTTTNGEVSTLQNFLYKDGYLTVTPTGYFGYFTRQAVKTFQRASGLNSVDGIVGMQTRGRIFETDCHDYTPPPVSAAPIINSMTPIQGPIGTIVALYGSGFTSSSVAHISIGGMSGNTISVSSDGTRLSFAVPSYIGPYCRPGVMCMMYASQLVVGGVYQISVSDFTGKFTSNSVSFTVTN
jgi:hypothetical protein